MHENPNCVPLLKTLRSLSGLNVRRKNARFNQMIQSCVISFSREIGLLLQVILKDASQRAGDVRRNVTECSLRTFFLRKIKQIPRLPIAPRYILGSTI